MFHNDEKSLNELPNEILLRISNLLPKNARENLSNGNRFFNNLRDPIYHVWESIIAKELKNNTLIDLEKLTFSGEKLICKLMKNYMLATLKNENFDVKLWLEKNPELLTEIVNIIIKPVDFDLENIAQRHENPKKEWNDYYNEYYILDAPPSFQELSALYISRFQSVYNESNLQQSIMKGSQLLQHLLFDGKFDFFSFEIAMTFLRLMNEPQQSRIQQALITFNNINEIAIKAEDKNIIFKDIIKRCLNALFNISINNGEKVKNLMISKLSAIVDPYFPAVENKQEDGYRFLFEFKTSEEAVAAKNKLNDVGLKPASGRVGKMFAVDLDKIEPAEIMIAYNKYQNSIKQKITKKVL